MRKCITCKKVYKCDKNNSSIFASLIAEAIIIGNSMSYCLQSLELFNKNNYQFLLYKLPVYEVSSDGSIRKYIF